MSSELLDVVLDNEVVPPGGANCLDRRFGSVEKQYPLPLRLNLRLKIRKKKSLTQCPSEERAHVVYGYLDDDVSDFEIGTVVDADVAAKRLSQVNRAAIREDRDQRFGVHRKRKKKKR